MHAASRLAAEALLEVGDEVLRRPLELLRQLDEPSEVVLPCHLALAETVRDRLQHSLLAGDPTHVGERPPAQRLQELLRGIAAEQRSALGRDLSVVQRLLVVGGARVCAEEDGHLLVRDATRVQLTDAFDEEPGLVHGLGERARDRLRPGGTRRAQHFLGAAELGDEPVRERQHLGSRAVVLLEPHDGRVREALRHREQVLGACACERVDRLVVVADRTQLVAIAEPAVEQCLLEEVHVLVLIDRERAVAVAHLLERALVRVEEPDRELDQVLEVDPALVDLAPLVLAVDAEHQVGRYRRLVVAQRAEVLVGRDAAVLGPLDLGGEVSRGTELVRPTQRVPDVPERERLRGQDPLRRLGGEEAELPERGRVKGRAAHTGDAELVEPRAHLPRGLVRKGHCEDLVNAKSPALNLIRDPMCDRRRLAGTRPGENANGPADGVDRTLLLGVQHRATLVRGPDSLPDATAPTTRQLSNKPLVVGSGDEFPSCAEIGLTNENLPLTAPASASLGREVSRPGCRPP